MPVIVKAADLDAATGGLLGYGDNPLAHLVLEPIRPDHHQERNARGGDKTNQAGQAPQQNFQTAAHFSPSSRYRMVACLRVSASQLSRLWSICCCVRISSI